MDFYSGSFAVNNVSKAHSLNDILYVVMVKGYGLPIKLSSKPRWINLSVTYNSQDIGFQVLDLIQRWNQMYHGLLLARFSG